MSSESRETTVVRSIGRYRAFSELGRGAMGVVYRGFDPVIGRTVALKTLSIDTADPQAREFRDRLYREAAAAGALSHPNIVTIFDIIEDGGVTAVAMEFIEGRSLAAIIAERAPLPIDLAVEILNQMCSALDYAGGHGIVHRDIKPANILVTSAGRAKVTDFGVARLALSTMTQAGTVLGSPSYMSPEQVKGLSLDGRSDLFSAAVVFFEMITRERPFSGNDIATTMYRIAHEPPTPPSQFNPAIGPGSRAFSNGRSPRVPPTGFKPAPTWSPRFERPPRLVRHAEPRPPSPPWRARRPRFPLSWRRHPARRACAAPPGTACRRWRRFPSLARSRQRRRARADMRSRRSLALGCRPQARPPARWPRACSSRLSRFPRSHAGRPAVNPPRQRRRPGGRAEAAAWRWRAWRQ